MLSPRDAKINKAQTVVKEFKKSSIQHGRFMHLYYLNQLVLPYWDIILLLFLFFFFFFFFFFKFYFIFKLYITVLDLPNIKMNTPHV